MTERWVRCNRIKQHWEEKGEFRKWEGWVEEHRKWCSAMKKKQSVKLTYINSRGSSREFTPGQTSVADSQILCKPMDFEDFRFTFFSTGLS